MKPFKRLTGSNGQPNRGSLWRRTKESVSVPDSSDLNCAELFLVLQFLLSSRALMKRLQRTTRRFPDLILNVSLSSLVTSRQITVSNCTAELAAMAEVKKGMRCHEASKTENVFVLFRAQHTGRRDWINWTPGL